MGIGSINIGHLIHIQTCNDDATSQVGGPIDGATMYPTNGTNTTVLDYVLDDGTTGVLTMNFVKDAT